MTQKNNSMTYYAGNSRKNSQKTKSKWYLLSDLNRGASKSLTSPQPSYQPCQPPIYIEAFRGLFYSGKMKWKAPNSAFSGVLDKGVVPSSAN